MSAMISTIDNPFNPFKDFDSWFQFDIEKGYNSCSYLARIARTSDQFSDKENEIEIERAIDDIIKYDFMDIYIKVTNDSDIDKENNNENIKNNMDTNK